MPPEASLVPNMRPCWIEILASGQFVDQHGNVLDGLVNNRASRYFLDLIMMEVWG
jgi:hypothetical protein